MPPRPRPNRFEPQAISMPTAIATRPAGMPFGYLHAAEPAHQDDGEADQADHRRHEHFERRPHRDEGDRDAGERAEQRRARRDPADVGRDEAADHQDEALEEHPDQAGLPALDRIAGLQRDRQHDHEGDDEHVRHADARRQRADVVAAGLLRQPVGEPGVVHGREAHHQAERRQDAAEHERVRHLQHEAQQPGQHQHVDEDVGAEAEEGVPVARRPNAGLKSPLLAVMVVLIAMPPLSGWSGQVSGCHGRREPRRSRRPSRRCRPGP